ncbi:DNA polymerase III subunit gamma/tau [Candidatus Vallotia tarda]|uniref:DNA polymerase III subunit gamma/tau n=1 Tax=Candidatus Vallotiella hemipterorum TaxID=1177213 RepID=A0A916JV47_9BURK|nr:DNA polymerase III subunit gamma/tau [Candidatus Vallotia tarda]CAG7602875.1 DNA polymerase III subunit gamma/tau [Candidatus Vallotia tarda]
MTYQVLARKWRPKDFKSLVGQEHVVRALTHILQAQRLHHAYLFTGTRGVGKTTLSRILAKALNCKTGITALPCGMCTTCLEIEGGRFVDYIEMDAASNRGIDEMAALLERAVYAPVNARFKVYMIDEAHMLTQHAFNSMLKMLEEPPPHVKFILATTDPKKIPATVLSRCLQFNLKRMPTGHIVSHLKRILAYEGISFEEQALRLLSRAADGSMRDALSLTDQAIGYAAGTVTEQSVRSMLGALDHSYLAQLLNAITMRDGARVLSVADEIAARSLSFSTALQDLSGLLHRIAWAQVVPNSVLDEWPEAEDIRHFATQLAPEAVQLYYQISTIGRAELGLAPDEYAGFTMALLRMLVFDTINAVCESTSENDIQPTSSFPPIGTDDLITSGVCSAETEQIASAVYWPGVPKPEVVRSKSDINTVVQIEKLSIKAECMKTTGTGVTSTNSSRIGIVCSQLDSIHMTNTADALTDAIESSTSKFECNRGVLSLLSPETASSCPDANSSASAALSTLHGPVIGIASSCIRSPAAPLENAPFKVQIRMSAQNMPPRSAEVLPQDNALPNHKSATLTAYNRTLDIDEPNFATMADNSAHDAWAISQPAVPAMSLNALSALGYDGDWPTLAISLPLRGIACQLALHSELVACNHNELILNVSIPQYADVVHVKKLKAAIKLVLGRPVHVAVSVGPTRQTAAAVEDKLRAQQQLKAEQEINSDPFVQTLIREFSATIVLGSIRPLMGHY